LCFEKFSSSLAQEVLQDRKTWKVVKVGPKRMGLKTMAPNELGAESVIEDQIPPGVTITVEILDLKIASLLRDVEIKVTNNATKPIYFCELGIVLPEVLSEAGYPISFPLLYGRLELIKLEAPRDDDVPLPPGESAVLKILSKNLTGFEKLAKKGKVSQVEIKRVYLTFRGLTFGDKTGFSSDGTAVPYIRNAGSANDCNKGASLNLVRTSGFWSEPRNTTDQIVFLPVGFTPGESPLNQISVVLRRHPQRHAISLNQTFITVSVG
jgi:hypothetical protein